MTAAVSVIIPAYGRTSALNRAIESVRAQPGVEVEIVVVDDGTPGGLDLQPGTEGLRVVRNERNSGAGAARNLGVANASHGVIAFLDSDDEWLPASLRSRLERLSPGTCVVAPHTRANDRTGKAAIRPLPDALETAIKTGNFIHPSTLVIFRDDFERAGGFPEDPDCAEDWVFVLRVLAVGIQLLPMPSPAATVHVDAANTTADARISAQHALGAVRHIDAEHLLSPADVSRTRRVVAARVAGFYANAAMVRPSLHHLRRAVVGPVDRSVLDLLLRVPVLGVRGVLRRRRDAASRGVDLCPR
jgi:glycosyltransferase involved in cell wall biosynthesis